MKNSRSESYAAAGVDITAGYKAVELMKEHVKRTNIPGVLSGIGGFGGLLLQGLTDHLWFDYKIVLFFWCFIGLGMAAVRVGMKMGEKEKEETEK